MIQSILSSRLFHASLIVVPLGLALLGWAIDHFSRRPRSDSLANIAIFLGNSVIRILSAPILPFAVFFWVARFAPWSIPASAGTFVLAFVLIDFIDYWRHRWEHEIHFFWCKHGVHHSSEEFNFSTGLRLPFLTVLSWIYYLPVVLIGFQPRQVILAYAVFFVYQYWVHSQVIGKLPVLDAIFNTPSNHRVHHAVNPEYLDKNYAGIFILWDKLFGTYAPEVAKPRYGTVTPVGTRNPFMINVRPFLQMFDKYQKQKTGRGRWNAIFGAPGATDQ